MTSGATVPRALALAILSVAGVAAAEPVASAGDDGIDRQGICLFALAYPRCRAIPVIETSVRTSPGLDPIGDSSPLSTTLEVGLILNLTALHSVGLSAGFLFDADYPAGTVRGRYRFWPIFLVPIEGSVAILIDRGGPHGGDGVGLALETAASLADAIALTAGIERHSRDDGSETLAVFGLRFSIQTLGVPSLFISR